MESASHKEQPIRVSVVMNCLDCSKYLREAIDSVYAQTYEDWEIIFWDNASADDSNIIAKSYDGKLRYFRSDETVPLGRARNYAIEQARGDYIAFLDCDDKWLPEKLEKQVAVFDRRPDIDFVYTNYYRIVMPKVDRLILGLSGNKPEGSVFERFLCHYPVNMQTVMLRKAVLEKLDDVFDEKLNLSEEYDLFMRILYNSKAFYLQEPLVIYRVHPAMSSVRYMSNYPNENTYILEKLKKMYPLMESEYSSAIKYANAKIGYWRAKAAMEQGNSKEARRHLIPYKFTSFKFFMLYLMAYFPGLWEKSHIYKEEGILRFS